MRAELEHLKRARGRLEKVRSRLTRPSVEALDGGAVDLRLAVESLVKVESSLRLQGQNVNGWQAVRVELEGMRREVRQVQQLLAGAGRFHEGWARLLSYAEPGVANYTSCGRITRAEVQDPSSVVIHG